MASFIVTRTNRSVAATASKQKLRFPSQLRQDFHALTQHLTRVTYDIVAYTKMYLPYFERVVVDRDAAKKAMLPNDRVRVFRKFNWLIWSTRFIGFEPLVMSSTEANKPAVGIILYPGAFVAAEAYTPLARSLADLGYYAAVMVPPFGLSFINVNMADEVIQFWGKKVKSWIVGGNSMGGVVAAAYAKTHANKIKGIVFLASYPSGSTSFLQGDLCDNTSIAALCCYGTMDGICTPDKVHAHKEVMPPMTVYCKIEGGNHSQFYYGTKLHKGDNPATITREEQQDVVREAILGLIRQIS